MLLIQIVLINGCVNNTNANKEDPKVTDIKIYYNTPVWELANAVKKNDAKKIKKILHQNQDIVNFKDSKYETTLLVWAVGMEKYDAAEALLECGADPNIISKYVGGTALYLASGFSWVDTSAKKDAKYVKLLLKYCADTNIGFIGNDHNNSTEIGTTPLINSIGCGIEKTKALVEGGADVNFQLNISKRTAAIKALSIVTTTTLEAQMEYAYYLIVEKKACVNENYYNSNGEKKPIDLLRNWIPTFDSNGYKMKMEIVDEFKNQGVDYWSTQIPKEIYTIFQKKYPEKWQEMINKY